MAIRGRFLEKRGFIELIQKPNMEGKGVHYQCPKCSEVFSTFRRIKAHRKEVHSY